MGEARMEQSKEIDDAIYEKLTKGSHSCGICVSEDSVTWVDEAWRCSSCGKADKNRTRSTFDRLKKETGK